MNRKLYNGLKILGMAVFGLIATVVIGTALFWPIALHYLFSQPLSIAVAINIVWIGAIL